MADDRYTTKIRAKRIELQYFKRLHAFRRWKLILSIAAPLVATAWLIAYAARGDQRIYTSGPLSTAHAMFWTQCSDCHRPPVGDGAASSEAPARGFFLRVSDQACLACHDGPIHHEAQAFDPTCASCHVEHKGRVALAALGDAQCTQCHADLGTKDRTPSPFAPKIRDFASSHPEFKVAVRENGAVQRVSLDRTAELKDTAQIKLNHQKHLKVGLKGLEELRALKGRQGILDKREGLQLGCAFCHQPEASRAAMQPISYAKHCGPACHPLDVDARLSDAVAPHDTPVIVHAYLRTLFIEAFEQCQALSPGPKTGSVEADKVKKQCQELELARADVAEQPRGGRSPSGAGDEGVTERPRGGRLGRRGEETETKEEPSGDQPRGRRLQRGGQSADEPGSDRPRGRRGRGEEAEARTAPARAAGASALEWASLQLPGAEKIMFKQKCEFCHTMTYAADRLPQVAPTAIPSRWLPHSVFDHGAHRPLACTECHKATMSKETTDVLLPSVAVCRECHRERGGARTGCVECHVYHDKTRERDPSGPFAVPQLVKGPPAAGGSPR